MQQPLKKIKFFDKICFTSPNKVDVLIFDAVGSEVLIKYVLYDINYSVFYNRHEMFYISPSIIFRIIINLIFEAISDIHKVISEFYSAHTTKPVDHINDSVLSGKLDISTDKKIEPKKQNNCIPSKQDV